MGKTQKKTFLHYFFGKNLIFSIIGIVVLNLKIYVYGQRKVNFSTIRNCPEPSTRNSYFVRRFRILGLPEVDVSCIIARYLVGIGRVDRGQGCEVKGAGSGGRGAMSGVRGTGVVGAGSGGRGCGKRGKTRPFFGRKWVLPDHFLGRLYIFLFFFAAALDFLIR